MDTASLAGLPLHRVKVLHNPIPQRSQPSRHALSSAEQLWNCPSSQRVLTVGSLKEQKNHPLLLRSFASMARKDCRLMILGGGDDAPLRSLAATLGIADRVIFAGFHNDPSPFYATADLFVLSSNYEGLPTVLIEALSFGVPIVSTDCPAGPSEILADGRWGSLVPVGNVEALTQAIEYSLSTQPDREALKQRAADFAPEIAARNYLELLQLS